MPRISGEPASTTIGALANAIGPGIYSGTPAANTALGVNCPTGTTAAGQLYVVSPTVGRKYLGITGRILASSHTAGTTLSLAPAVIAMGGATPTRDATRAVSIAANVLGSYTIIFPSPVVLGNVLIGVSFIVSASAAIDFDATMLVSA